MKAKLWLVSSLMVVVALVLVACGGPATTAAPPAEKVEVTLWHAYHTGGSEEAAITQLLETYRAANPNVTVNVLAVPFDQIFSKWETEVAAGGGPDMFTAPNDSLGDQVRAELVAPIDDLLAGQLGGVAQAGVDGMKVDGQIYGVPGIIKAVALYYNKSSVPNPPKSTDELLDLVKGGKRLVIYMGGAPYFNFGWYSAFGGKLADDTGRCVADAGGVADSLQYLLDLKSAGAVFENDNAKGATQFRQGEVDMIVDGPWMLGDYKKDLGADLGVAPLPAGPGGTAAPLSGVDGWYINPNSLNKAAAVDVALYLFGADGLQVYADVAGDPPVRTDVNASDPLVDTFADAAAAGLPRPQAPWFSNYWGPFGDMFTAVIEGQSSPQDAVVQACADMNAANGFN